MASKEAKARRALREKIQEVVTTMQAAHDGGARSGVLYFKDGFRGELNSDGSLGVSHGSPMRAVYAAPTDWMYRSEFSIE